MSLFVKKKNNNYTNAESFILGCVYIQYIIIYNFSLLLIPNYMTKNVVSNVIITLHILGNIVRLLLDYF